MSNVPTYHTFLLQRSDKGDRAYQRTQGTWLRPHNRKNTQRELRKKAINLLSILLNSMPRLSYYPLLWKFAQIIMVPKPGKPINDVTSYRPISLLPLSSKIFQKHLLQILRNDVDLSALLANYQSGFEPVLQPFIKRTASSMRSPRASKRRAFLRQFSSMSPRHSIESGIQVCCTNSRPPFPVRII